MVAGLCSPASGEWVLLLCLGKAPVMRCLIPSLFPHSFLLPMCGYSLSHSGMSFFLPRAEGSVISEVGPQGQRLRSQLSQLRRFRAELPELTSTVQGEAGVFSSSDAFTA